MLTSVHRLARGHISSTIQQVPRLYKSSKAKISPPLITVRKKKKGKQSSQASLTARALTASTGDALSPNESPPCRPNQVSTGKGKQPTIGTPAPGTTTAPIDEKQYNRFFGSILLLHALDPARGARKQHPKFPDPDDLDSNELLCSFLDSVSYACDRKHGGDTVTAAALQDDPEGPVLLLASNSRIGEPTQVAVREILKDLARFEFGKESREKETELENDIVRKLRTLATDRLREYQKRAQGILEGAKSMKGLDKISTDYLSYLSIIVSDDDLEHVILSCYEAVRRPELVHLRNNVENQGRSSSIVSDIRHSIGRLGYHVSVAKILIRTARDPSNARLFAELRIQVIPSSTFEGGPLTPETCTLDSIISRVCQKSDVQRYSDLLNSRNSKFHLNLPERIRDSCSIKTRTHAELLVVDYIRTRNVNFYNPNMRYVGCSKAACYLCWRYVAAMKGEKFQLRGSHEKIYVAWRPPDIPYGCEDMEERWLERRDILNEMKESMSREIMVVLERGASRRPMHPDSTTGVSTVTPISGSEDEHAGLRRAIDRASANRIP